MIKVYLVFISLLIISNNLFPQVKIKERINIKPSVTMGNSNNVSHTLRFEFNWTNSIHPVCIQAVGYGISDWSSSGGVSFTVTNAPPADYNIIIRVNWGLYPAPEDKAGIGDYEVYSDDSVVYSSTGILFTTFSDFGEGQGNLFLDYVTPYFSNLNLHFGNGCGWQPVWVTPSNDTSQSTWNPSTDSVKISIISGGEYVSFYLWDGEENTLLGDTINYSYSYPPSDSKIEIVNDVPVLDTTGIGSIIIKAEVNGLTSTQSINLIPDNHFTINSPPWDIRVHRGGQSDAIWLYIQNPCGIPVPDQVKFKASIVSGNQFGDLIDPATETVGKELINLHPQWGSLSFIYKAAYSDSLNVDTVLIRVTSNSVPLDTFYQKIYIDPFPFVVTIDPPNLGAKDTAIIIIKHRKPDGTIEDFDEYQTFEVGILEGCVNGKLFAKSQNQYWEFVDSLDVYFSCAKAPIKFIAADTIDTDYDTVKIRVGYSEGIATLTLKNNNKIKAEKVERIGNYLFGHMNKHFLTRQKKKELLEKIRKYKIYREQQEGGSCYIGPYNSNYIRDYGLPFISIHKISPDSIDQWIETNDTTHLPIMPVIKCKAELKGAIINILPDLVKWEWTYQVSYKYLRDDRHDVNGVKVWDTNLSSRIDTLEFADTSYGSMNPGVIPFDSSGIKRIRIIATKPERKPPFHRNNIYGGDDDNIITSYEGYEGRKQGQYFTGGDVKLFVKASYDGIKIAKAKFNLGKIRGRNLDVNVMKNSLKILFNKDYRAIIQHETNNKYRQFSNVVNEYYPFGNQRGDTSYPAGFPIYGYPNGYGMAQIDDHPREMDLWNWKENAGHGLTKFNDCKPRARNFFLDNGLSYSDTSKEFLRTAYNYYNGKEDYYIIVGGVPILNTDNLGEGETEIDIYGHKVYEIYLILQ